MNTINYEEEWKIHDYTFFVEIFLDFFIIECTVCKGETTDLVI